MWTGIELLHILQDIRLDYPFLEGFFVTISSKIFYMIIPIMLVIAIMWLYDKEKGEIIGLGCVSATIMSSIIKLLVAQPRPWVLDPTLEQVPGADADGYSLPSGHTTLSVSVYLPLAWYYRHKKALSVSLVVIALLIIVARLVLCVHTPLDIITGISLAIIMVFIANKAVELGKRSERTYYGIASVYLVAFTALAVFAVVHTGAEMKEILQSSGFFYGFMIGRIIEHRYVGYIVKDRTGSQKAKAYVIGMLVAAILLVVPMVAIPVVGTFIGGILLMVWCFALYPMVMMKKGL